MFTQEVDVSDEARVVQGMAEAVEEMGRVDGVIANAGLMRNEGSFVAMSSEAWHGLLGREPARRLLHDPRRRPAHEAPLRRR